jgi:TolA-binding protein
MTVGQTLEIPFRGTGWVHRGDLRSQRGITYLSHRDDAEGQIYVFRADEPGTFDLKFDKRDLRWDYTLNDYVRVIVDAAPERDLFSAPENRSRVVANPRWPLPPEAQGAEQAPGTTGGAAGGSPQTSGAGTAPAQNPGVVQPGGSALPEAPADGVPEPPAEPSRENGSGVSSSPAFPPGALPEDFLRRAREEFDAGRKDSALAMLDLFRERYPSGSDEAWWLYGQILEANGAGRDVRSALDYYRRLVREYPQSPRYAEARRRIAYLERFFFNIQ